MNVFYDVKQWPNHRVHREWQLPIFGVHSIMMEKSAPAEGVVWAPTPFNSSYEYVQSCSVRPSWEGRYTPPILSLPLNVLCGPNDHIKINFLTGDNFS